MDVTFRRATRADLPSIIALIAEDQIGQTREDPSTPLNENYLAAFDAIARDDNQLMAVAEQDGAVIGCLQITFIPGISRNGMWRGNIESVRVSGKLRGQGIGRAFFAWAIAQCRARGCGLVQLMMNQSRVDAGRFYQSLGFKQQHFGMRMDL
jgi:ribosomal protein S18 acetylase RimI-like enzyme